MKKVKPNLIISILLLMVSAVLIFVMAYNDNQSSAAMLMRVTFQGEYQTGSEGWKPFENDTRITCLEEEVHLKGFFQLEAPDGTVLGKVPKDLPIITYFDHIGGKYTVGQLTHEFDMENKLCGNSACGENWVIFECPIDENETLEIVLRNPHKYGNGNAVETFLDSMYIYPETAFEQQMIKESTPHRTVGIVVMVVALILLGAALFSTMLRVPHSGIIWLFGLMILFAGAFFVLDSPNFCLSSNHTFFNTTAKNLCIILYPAFMFMLTQSCLKDKLKKIGGIIAGSYGVFSITAVIIASTMNMLIYDLNYYLLMLQLVAAAALIVLCILNFKGLNVKQRAMTAVCLAALLALGTDITAVFMGIWHTAAASKIAFSAVFIPALFYSLKFIPLSIKARIHEKELQLELQQSYISVMLSQIQPHFLYNVLSAICDLCGSEPLKARDALVDFSVYLRDNMDSIGSRSVRFQQELSYIKTYLKLEKLRFGDKINVVYDIAADDFEMLPFTIQPIVENAVKHGICMKENGGTITLKTSEEDGIVTITITDDGVGFDVNSINTQDDKRSHIGLENVRKRIEQYPDGKLTVESEKGKGTVVTICFRK